MSFSINSFDKLSQAGIPSLPTLWGYKSASDSVATIETANYFDGVGVAPLGNSAVSIGDYIWLHGSDGSDVALITAVDPHVTVSPMPLTVNANTITSSMMVDNMLHYATVSISAAEMKNAYTAPKLLLAAPGSNKLIVLESCDLLMTYNAAAYAAGGTAAIQYDSTVHGGGTLASTTLANTVFQATESDTFTFNKAASAKTFAASVNKGLYLSNLSGDFTTGDSALVAHIWYRIIPTV